MPVAENIAANRRQTQIFAANITFGQTGARRAIFLSCVGVAE